MIFSVLISVYAKELPENLRQSLESIFHQELPPDEVVLVEDGPLTDGLHEVIRAFRVQVKTAMIRLKTSSDRERFIYHAARSFCLVK